jgi:hypothetical protein
MEGGEAMEAKKKEEMIKDAQRILDLAKVRLNSKLTYLVIDLDWPSNYIVDVSRNNERVWIRMPLHCEFIQDCKPEEGDLGMLRGWFRRTEMEIRKKRVAGKEI